MSKGDNVRVIANDCEHELEIGYTGIIEEYYSDNDFKIDFWQWHLCKNDVEAITRI